MTLLLDIPSNYLAVIVEFGYIVHKIIKVVIDLTLLFIHKESPTTGFTYLHQIE